MLGHHVGFEVHSVADLRRAQVRDVEGVRNECHGEVAGFETGFGDVLQEKLPRILTSLTQDLKASAIASTSDRV